MSKEGIIAVVEEPVGDADRKTNEESVRLTAAGRAKGYAEANVAEKPAEAHPMDDQIKLAISAEKKHHVFQLLMLVCFFDMLGPIMMTSAEVALCNVNNCLFPGQCFETTFGLEFSLARAFLMSSGVLGVMVCSVTLVPLSDKWGRKPMLLLFLFGGVACFCILAIAGDVNIVGSAAYPAYIAGRFLLGIVGSTDALVSLYLSDIYPVDEAIPKQQQIGMVKFVSAGLGAVLGGQLTSTGTLTAAAWFGCGLQLFGGMIILIWIPNPRQAEKKVDAEVTPDTPPVKTGPAPELPVKKFAVVVVTALFDALGSSGLSAALSMVLVVRFPTFATPALYSLAQGLLVVCVFVGFLISIPTMAKMGYGFNSVLGNVAACAGQVVLIFMLNEYGFLVALYITFTLSFFSTVSYQPMIFMLCPPQMKGKVLGRFTAVVRSSDIIMPLLLAAIIGDGSGQRVEFAIMVTAICSGIGTFLSIPLLKMFPKPPKKPLHAEELPEDDYWEPWDKVATSYYKGAAEGRLDTMKRFKFGTFDVDKDQLDLVLKRGEHDFRSLRNETVPFLKTLEDKEEREKQSNFLDQRRKKHQEEVARGEYDEYFKEMGLWLGYYMACEGHNPSTMPNIYKVRFMKMFPPPADEVRTRVEQNLFRWDKLFHEDKEHSFQHIRAPGGH